jgi:hypothetical protein
MQYVCILLKNDFFSFEDGRVKLKGLSMRKRGVKT